MSISSDMQWRNAQLKWYGGDTLHQDHDLSEFISRNGIRRILYRGSDTYLDELIGHSVIDNPDMCIYVVNTPFKFSKVVSECQSILDTQLKSNGVLYLSINKFLAEHEYYRDCEEDYDEAIYSLIHTSISHKIEAYHSGANDYGDKFNWAHPITRFYFRKQ